MSNSFNFAGASLQGVLHFYRTAVFIPAIHGAVLQVCPRDVQAFRNPLSLLIFVRISELARCTPGPSGFQLQVIAHHFTQRACLPRPAELDGALSTYVLQAIPWMGVGARASQFTWIQYLVWHRVQHGHLYIFCLGPGSNDLFCVCR